MATNSPQVPTQLRRLFGSASCCNVHKFQHPHGTSMWGVRISVDACGVGRAKVYEIPSALRRVM